MMTSTHRNNSGDYAACVGLDWGDQTHALSLCDTQTSRVERKTLQQSPEALADWVNGLRSRFTGGKIAVCLEQSRGALIGALMGYEHLVLYPINPKSLARFREALYPSGSKNDPSDGDLLLNLLIKHSEYLRPWQPDTVQTRELAQLNEHRREFVDQRTALTNKLQSHLKAVFPQALELLGADLSSRLATDFLKKWSSLEALKKAKPTALRKFYYAHQCRSETRITQRLELIKKAVCLTTDPALLGAHALAIQTVVAQLETLRPFLQQYDQRIARLFTNHPDAFIFQSLPGAGQVLAPRLLTSLGTQRDRYPKAVGLQCYTGIAPVTEKSGKSQHWVHLRWSCPKFLRQSWHEFANCSRKFSTWARLCYEDLRTRMDHHEAIRKLAFKWQRIVWRMWQNREAYDEERYLKALQKKGLQLYAIAPTSP